jgi:hypothetical protein
MQQSTLYAHKSEDGSTPGCSWTDFYPDPRATRFCDTSLPVYKVQVVADEGGDHWGWWDKADEQFSFVERHKHLVTLCFPNPDSGLLVKVRVEEVERWKPQPA